MNISLPTTNNKKGFTLIELLVVITILAVLAVIGFAAFRGFTSRGNDVRRNSDLKAVADALEANKTAAGYQVLANSQFANGTLPADPVATKPYCVSSVTTAGGGTIGNKPSAWTTTCPSAVLGVGVNGTAFTPITAASPFAPAANTTTWMICATMEDGATVNCRNSAQ